MMTLRPYRLNAAGFAAVIFAAVLVFGTAKPLLGAKGGSSSDFRTPIRFTPFTEELPIPSVMQPVDPFAPQCEMGLPAGMVLNTPKFYEVTMREATVQIIPGVDTVIWGYNGLFPGPTFKALHNEPAIVRFHNDLNVTTIVHNHGGHTPARSDGSASVDVAQLIPPGESRDFCYPNIAPVVDLKTLEQDISDFG